MDWKSGRFAIEKLPSDETNSRKLRLSLMYAAAQNRGLRSLVYNRGDPQPIHKGVLRCARHNKSPRTLLLLLLCFSPCQLASGAEPVPAKLPFNRSEIKTIAIFGADESGEIKTRLATVGQQRLAPIFAGLQAARTQDKPDKAEIYSCEYTRKAVIELNSGTRSVLRYHGECDSPELNLAEDKVHKTGRRLPAIRLKETLRLLESNSLVIHVARLIKDEDGEFAVVTTSQTTLQLTNSPTSGTS